MNKLLLSLTSSTCRSAADWAHLLPKDGTLSVSARVWGCTTVSNSALVEKRVRDAVCDAVRDAR